VRVWVKQWFCCLDASAPKSEKPAIIKSEVADYVVRYLIISDAQTLLGIVK